MSGIVLILGERIARTRALIARMTGPLALIIVFGVTTTVTAFAQHGSGQSGSTIGQTTLSPELAVWLAQSSVTNPDYRVNVIVQFRNPPTSKHFQKMNSLGSLHSRHLSVIRGGRFDLPASSLQALALDPDVAYISPDRLVQGAADYFQETVGADLAQSNGWNGSGLAVAVIDSGISDHPDLHDPATGLDLLELPEG